MPFTRDVEIFDLGAGAEFVMIIKATPEDIARLQGAALKAVGLAIKERGLQSVPRSPADTGGCGCNKKGE